MSELELLDIIQQPLPERSSTEFILLKQQQRDALECLLQEHYPWVYRFCLAECRGDTDRAAEYTQEVMLRVTKGVAGFKRKAQFRTWVFAILKLVVREMRRKERIAALRFAFGLDMDSPAPDRTESRLMEFEQNKEIFRALSKLPQRQRDAVLFHYFENLPIAEISTCMGCSQGSVKTHLVRARQRLAKLLGSYHEA